ncbi:MAG: hypothetical protein MSG64_05410 [Pyrinomonadaceae bacterium MAG19_C2-C3]|nr:hypothetical protein [Pyrinomonadaceae bacterium MAG19_C2-C3]
MRCAVNQLETGEAKVENAYARAVSMEGNNAAQKMIEDVFEINDRAWRGIGVIPQSGWRLTEKYLLPSLTKGKRCAPSQEVTLLLSTLRRVPTLTI